MARVVRVSGAARLGHGEAAVFDLADGEQGFVLRLSGPDGAGYFAYRNRCAHMAVDLDMGTGRFWSSRLGRIVCKTHGATFRAIDGRCDAGPCVGRSLSPLRARVEGDDLLVDDDSRAASPRGSG